jgi:glycosyltransferase involved in cell wall biosynthesis
MLGLLGAEELTRWYGRAAIYALPARYEPFGLSVLEGALCGCALVLGDIPSLRETWQDAAVFLPPDDARAWKSGLRRLIDDDSRRRELGLQARRRAIGYTAERMAEEYAACYADAARGRENACAS